MGKFLPGQKKPESSGRRKGIPNKRTALLREILDKLGYNVPERLVALLPQLPADKQADVLRISNIKAHFLLSYNGHK